MNSTEQLAENGPEQASTRALTKQHRRSAPKVRTGCITCKIRRVKCDEGKPTCARCESSGRRCDGYGSPEDSVQQMRGVNDLAVALPLDSTASPRERRAFKFFRERTAPCVSGYFHDPVWNQSVLQLSHSEPAILHALTALSALHEEKVLTKENGTDVALVNSPHAFAMTQYSKALNEMRTLLNESQVCLNKVLVCAMLCIHFETLRESFVPALLHVDNVIKLLHSPKIVDAQDVDPNLVRVIMRMDLQGALYSGSRVPGLSFCASSGIDSVLPETFDSLTHARDVISTWTCYLYYFLRTVADEQKFRVPDSVPLDELVKAQELETAFLSFEDLLWSLMHRPNVQLTTREHHGLSMLRNRVKINRILAATCLYLEASMFDTYLEEFEDILTTCMYIISNDSTERLTFSISLDEGFAQSLFFICTQCRDSRIRNRALELLKKIPAQDGVWYIEPVKKIAEICIRFEEAPCEKETPLCKDIPEWRRIHKILFDGWDGHENERVVKVKVQTRFNGMDGEWQSFEESFKWETYNQRFEASFDQLMMGQLPATLLLA